MDILNLIKKPEGKTLEFKQDLSSPMSVLRTMVAFANMAGGTVIIGVTDKARHICGVENPLALEEKLANLISDNIEPQLIPEIEVISWRENYLLSIQVFPSSSKPHYLRKQGLEKGTYIRVGSTNRLADKTMIGELQRVKIEDAFDKQPISALNSEAIDFRVASELFSDRHNLKPKDLESLDIITTYQNKKVPTAGGLILFGKARLKYFPDAWIQVGRFEGVTKTNILDTQKITSYPPLAVEEALSFVKKHAVRGIQIKGAKHTEKWSVPLTAVREAIINAVVHADYAQQGAPIRIAIFDDRIEIENPGLLLFGLTIEEIKQGISKLRNRVLGQVFHRLGLIERWGSGIKRMIELCTEAGFAEPMFEEIATHFRVTIFTTQVEAPRISATDQAILACLKKSNGLSTKQIAEHIKLSERAIRNRLIALIEKGLIVELGSGINDPKRKYFYKN